MDAPLLSEQAQEPKSVRLGFVAGMIQQEKVSCPSVSACGPRLHYIFLLQRFFFLFSHEVCTKGVPKKVESLGNSC